MLKMVYKQQILICYLIVIGCNGVADDITTKFGTVYKDVSVVSNRSDSTGVYIKHKSGALKLLFTEMNKEAQLKFGYDADKIAQQEKEKQEAQAKALEILKHEEEQKRIEAQEKAQEKAVLEKNQNDAIAKMAAQARLEKEKNLSFKGIYLRMGRNDIRSLADGTKNYDKRFSIEKFNEQFIYLVASKNATEEFKSISVTTDGENKEYVYWEDVDLEMYKDMVYEISVNSSEVSATGIDPDIKKWLLLALKGLTDKYGKHTDEFISIKDLNIFSFKSGYNVYMYSWEKDNQRIVLAINENENKYSAIIKFTDMKLKEMIDGATKIKSTL